MYSLIVTCKLNDVDPQAWLADVLARIADHPVQQLDALIPWNWKQAKSPLPHKSERTIPIRLTRGVHRTDTNGPRDASHLVGERHGYDE